MGKHYISCNRPFAVSGGNVRISKDFQGFSGNRKILYKSQEVLPGLDHSQAEDHQETQGIPTFSMGSQRSFLPWAGSSFGLPLRAASSAGRKPCFPKGFRCFQETVRFWGPAIFLGRGPDAQNLCFSTVFGCFFSWLGVATFFGQSLRNPMKRKHFSSYMGRM